MSMQLTLAADYAVRALVHLAAQPAANIVPIGEIAQAQDIPVSFLRKIVAQFRSRGIVRSTRGVKGGVRLLKDPKEITLLSIVEAIDGPIVLNRCLFCPPLCARTRRCPVHPVWSEAQKALLSVLRSKTLLDLAGRQAS